MHLLIICALVDETHSQHIQPHAEHAVNETAHVEPEDVHPGRHNVRILKARTRSQAKSKHMNALPGSTYKAVTIDKGADSKENEL
jgi:hypothetical protein